MSEILSSQLLAELSEFLELGPSLVVGTCDLQHNVESTRVAAARVEPDGRVLCSLLRG
jgi:hypothetical protein